MLEKTKDNQKPDSEVISEETSLTAPTETDLAKACANLSAESQRLVGELTFERDRQKMQAIEQQFNDIQRKKQLARVSKLSDVQDMLTDQFYRRISQKPDEISNKEMLDGMKVVQDLMEKNLKQAETIEEIPKSNYVTITITGEILVDKYTITLPYGSSYGNIIKHSNI